MGGDASAGFSGVSPTTTSDADASFIDRSQVFKPSSIFDT
jgi:hypothetical protein